ncbi:hypothetical protein ACI798_15465 [Geodermatophilus sp. SYSU D01045]
MSSSPLPVPVTRPADAADVVLLPASDGSRSVTAGDAGVLR